MVVKLQVISTWKTIWQSQPDTRRQRLASTAENETAENEEHHSSSVWLPLSIVVLPLIAWIAYSNSLSYAFVFDDQLAIVENASLDNLSSAWNSGLRRVAYVTFHWNKAFHGLEPYGFRATNVGIHAVAGVLLFLVTRLILVQVDGTRNHAGGLAFLISAIWIAHPLASQAVVYIVQRMESLSAMLMLAACYLFMLGRSRQAWVRSLCYLASLVVGAAAVLTKESAVVFPVLVAVYDYLFCSKTFQEQWRQGRLYYGLIALGTIPAAIWLYPVIFPDSGPGQAGFGATVVSWPAYLMTQPEIILHYSRLCLIPVGQCLDYGWAPVSSVSEALLPGLVILALISITAFGVYRRRAWSFVGVVFFVCLAPTSSFVPVQDLAFEHRMYLANAALIAGLVLIGFALVSKYIPGQQQRVLACVGGVVVVCLLVATRSRTTVFESSETLWLDVVAKSPHNWRGHFNLGEVLENTERTQLAAEAYQRSLDLQGRSRVNIIPLTTLGRLAVCKARMNETKEAKQLIAEALARAPENVEVLLSAASVATQTHDVIGARKLLVRALQLEPSNRTAKINLGIIQAGTGEQEAAMATFKEVLREHPGDEEALKQIEDLANREPLSILLAAGDQYRKAGKRELAIACYRKAVLEDPMSAIALNSLGAMLAAESPEEAVECYQRALNVDSQNAEAHSNLANVYARSGNFEQAISHYEIALRIRPGLETASRNLQIVKSLQAQQ